MEREELKEVLSEILKTSHIDSGVHSDHHEFIEMLRLREQRRIEVWQKFKLSFIGTLATALVGGLIWVGNLVLEVFRSGHHP